MSKRNSKSATILISGDVHLGGGRVTDLARKGDVNALFGDYTTLIESCDLSVANLESPVIDEGDPIPKIGPNLKSPADTLPVMKKAGFDLLTLSNNHIMDYGAEGLRSTMKECRRNDLAMVGAGVSFEEASKPFTCEINGLKIAILNIAENEFGTTQNGEPGGYGLDPVQNYYSIQRCRKEADTVIVIVHGGHEHYELPSPRMNKTYRFYADAGADAVVGHHTHCISGFEEYHGTPIIYSLGNFLFDRNQPSSKVGEWNRGQIVELLLSGQKKIDFKLHPYVQGADLPGLRKLSDRELKVYQNDINLINDVIQNDKDLEKKFREYCELSYNMYSGFIEPHSVRVLHALRNRNILPSMLSTRKKRLLYNLVRCEAHRDVLIKTLSL